MQRDDGRLTHPYTNTFLHSPSDKTQTRIEGEFPDARYFSVQAYDDTFSPINSLRDFEIEPAIGNNPFAKKPATQLTSGGRYKIFLTKDGRRGLPNEMAMANGNYSQVRAFAHMHDHM